MEMRGIVWRQGRWCLGPSKTEECQSARALLLVPTECPDPRPSLSRCRVARWRGPCQRRQGLGGGPGRCRQYRLTCPLGWVEMRCPGAVWVQARAAGIIDVKRDYFVHKRAVARGNEWDVCAVVVVVAVVVAIVCVCLCVCPFHSVPEMPGDRLAQLAYQTVRPLTCG